MKSKSPRNLIVKDPNRFLPARFRQANTNDIIISHESETEETEETDPDELERIDELDSRYD
jgi:hypothetical protein